MPRDAEYLQDAITAANDSMTFVAGHQLATFETDTQTKYSVSYALIVLSEALSRVSAETQAVAPDVPWAAIRGFRNIIVHEYDHVNVAVVWRIVHEELPTLVPYLQALLADLTGEDV